MSLFSYICPLKENLLKTVLMIVDASFEWNFSLNVGTLVAFTWVWKTSCLSKRKSFKNLSYNHMQQQGIFTCFHREKAFVCDSAMFHFLWVLSLNLKYFPYHFLHILSLCVYLQSLLQKKGLGYLLVNFNEFLKKTLMDRKSKAS